MATMDNKVVEQLKPSDVEEVKYILKDKFADMFHWILILLT